MSGGLLAGLFAGLVWGARAAGTAALGGSSYDLAFGDDGLLYAADFRADRVRVFTAGLEPVRSFPCPSPHGVAVGAGGVFVPTYRDGRLRRFSKDGTEAVDWDRALRAGGHLELPVSAAVDADGTVFVADYAKRHVVAVSSSGVPTAVWRPSGPSLPHGVAAAGGRVYVADRAAKAVVVYDREGRRLAELRAGPAFDPLSARPLPDGRVLSADYASGRVLLFSADGRSHRALRARAEAPTNAVVGPDGALYVVEEKGKSLRRFPGPVW